LAQLLRRLNTSATVMMIGAHPDDEDTALLAYLARGENARTAYLSLTRGDGGQNIIGPELRESLGVIRTEELLQARRLDGAEQYFTRAYDYGFSKTLDEAKRKWDEKIVLCDAVRAIRWFRPLVVIAQFTGTPADGHGQHQYVGYISPLAVKAAADSSQCSASGAAWKVRKFYVRHRGSGDPTLRINTGKYDPLLGRSYFEIAMEARSQHKSQEQGVLELRGPQYSAIDLVDSEGNESGVFDGLDISINGIAANTGNSEEPFAEKLRQLQGLAARASSEFEIDNPGKILSLLVPGYKHAYDAEWSTRRPDSKAFLEQKQREFLEAIKLAAGIQIDALADRETVAPGETFPVALKVFSPQQNAIAVKKINWDLPTGWAANPAEPPKETGQQSFRRETPNYSALFNISVPKDTLPTQPYWLAQPRDGDLFRWTDGKSQTLPFDPPQPTANVTLTYENIDLTFPVTVQYRFADDVRGEVRRNVEVVPVLSVKLDQDLLIVPASSRPQARRVVLSITKNAVRPVNGTVSLTSAPDQDWKYASEPKSFELNRKGEKATLAFDVPVLGGIKPGKFRLVCQAMTSDGVFESQMNLIAYPHIQTHRYYTPAATSLEIFDLAVSPVNVGYIAGSGDAVPEAIMQMALAMQMLGEDELSSGDLSKYDVIVVGIRASQVRPDFISNQPRLIDYVKRGGVLLVQYQLPIFQGLLPFPAQMGPRVADENAQVTILQPGHPIFNFPNKITQEDFKGWIQERNLYNLTNFDPRYTPLLESHDPGDPENKGGLVVAEIGSGKYIYCSYSLFRQLPAGVPGAYRLLANMLSLPKAKTAKLLDRR
jgi:LmbE family N-acetylglucosaminyl deacetylase